MNYLELLERYNHPVPRYTSYPPANFFSGDYNGKSFMYDVERSNQWKPENISIYIHIPFCKKMCLYCGCNSIPMANPNTVNNYIKALQKEISMISMELDPNRKVSQIHYGGGTPNALDPGYIQELNAQLFETFSFIDNPEIAIECHPALMKEDYPEQLIKSGFNRFSLGIQDFKEEVLSSVNRDPSFFPINELMERLRNGNPASSFNLDFMYGLPHQTTSSFLHTIQQAIDIKPERLVTFSYAHVPWVNKMQLKLEKIGLPDQKEKFNMFIQAHELLSHNGYQPIGMDHYVLEKDELFKAQEQGNLHRNFQGYCTKRTTGQVYAFGVSAISQLNRSYAQNTKSIVEYIGQMGKKESAVVKGYSLNDNEILTREVITEIMCNRKLDWSDLAGRFEMEPEQLKSNVGYEPGKMKAFLEDGIISITNDNIRVTDSGTLFIRNVAAAFDPLLSNVQHRFSKPV